MSTEAQLVADVLVHTVLRWPELAGLHWHRVDLRRGLLRVVEVYDETSGSMNAYPKRKPARTVPLTPELQVVLAERRRAHPPAGDCGVAHGSGICRGGLVFAIGTGRPLRNSNWASSWREAVTEAVVGRVRIRDLRHTFASWLLQEGIPIAEVGRLLGHVSTQTTAKYAHLAEPPSAAILAALSAGSAPRLPHDGAADTAG